MMVAVGIDPGSQVTGWAVVERRRAARGHAPFRRLASAAIRLGSGPLLQRLRRLDAALREALETPCDVSAIETGYTRGTRGPGALVLAEARGVCRLHLRGRVVELAPTRVKAAVAGSGRATKDAVRRAVESLTGYAPTSEDESDAIAVAIAALLEARR